MSESTERDPSTQYLLYKVALKCRDTDLGRPLLDQQPERKQPLQFSKVRVARTAESIMQSEATPGVRLIVVCLAIERLSAF